MPDPALVVSPLTPEEAPVFMRIRHIAFRDDVNKVLYFHGEPSQKTLDRVVDSIREGMQNGAIFLKCVDTTTNEIIAVAKWRYIRPANPAAKERTWEEVEQGLTIPEPYDESHPEVWNVLFELFNSKKREHMGTRPYYILDTLVTLSEHHRRGAGSLLLNWGRERADEAGVEMYLEASPMGQPLYARYGFEPLGPLVVDLRRWGGDIELRCMVSWIDGMKYDILTRGRLCEGRRRVAVEFDVVRRCQG